MTENELVKRQVEFFTGLPVSLRDALEVLSQYHKYLADIGKVIVDADATSNGCSACDGTGWAMVHSTEPPRYCSTCEGTGL